MRAARRHLEAVTPAWLFFPLSPLMSRSVRFFRPLAGNNVLIVAHASSLEACTRQLQGRGPLSPKDFIQVVRKVRPAATRCSSFGFCSGTFWFFCVPPPPQIPYLGFCSCQEQGDTGVWQLADPPILPLTHGPNHSFDWRETLLQE